LKKKAHQKSKRNYQGLVLALAFFAVAGGSKSLAPHIALVYPVIHFA